MKLYIYTLAALTFLLATPAHAQISYNVGRESAVDMLFNMPTHSLASTPIASKLAEQAGSAVWNDYGFLGVNVPATLRGANTSGKIDMSLIINADLSFTATIKGQVGNVLANISGSLEGQIGANVTGTFNLFYEWASKTDMEGDIYVEYKIGIGAEVRTGHLKTNHNIVELGYTGPGSPPVASPAEVSASAANGGRLVYKGSEKYYRVIPSYILFPSGGGTVIIYPTEYPGF